MDSRCNCRAYPESTSTQDLEPRGLLWDSVHSNTLSAVKAELGFRHPGAVNLQSVARETNHRLSPSALAIAVANECLHRWEALIRAGHVSSATALHWTALTVLNLFTSLRRHHPPPPIDAGAQVATTDDDGLLDLDNTKKMVVVVKLSVDRHCVQSVWASRCLAEHLGYDHLSFMEILNHNSAILKILSEDSIREVISASMDAFARKCGSFTNATQWHRQDGSEALLLHQTGISYDAMGIPTQLTLLIEPATAAVDAASALRVVHPRNDNRTVDPAVIPSNAESATHNEKRRSNGATGVGRRKKRRRTSTHHDDKKVSHGVTKHTLLVVDVGSPRLSVHKRCAGITSPVPLAIPPVQSCPVVDRETMQYTSTNQPRAFSWTTL